MSEIDTKLYDAMGQRFAVVKHGVALNWYEVTANPDNYHKDRVVARNLKYTEAHAIIKLIGEHDGKDLS